VDLIGSSGRRPSPARDLRGRELDGSATHCAHHHPVAVVALLWIKIIAFTLFHAFAILHGKLFGLGKATLNEVRKQIYRSLLCGRPCCVVGRFNALAVEKTENKNPQTERLNLRRLGYARPPAGSLPGCLKAAL